MTRLRGVAMLAGMTLAFGLGACGATPAATAPKVAATWYPSTPIPTPGPARPNASVAATAAAPPGVGQATNTGLGTPAKSVSATAQLAFNPTAITVKTGQVIQWSNTGNIPHNVTFDSQPSLSSGTLAQGDTWQVQFTSAGTYKYHCTFHPGMNGQVTVGG
jgi:plastocyanin